MVKFWSPKPTLRVRVPSFLLIKYIMKLVFKALFFLFVCNVIIDWLENNTKLKIDKYFKNTICVTLHLLSVGYCGLILLYIVYS